MSVRTKAKHRIDGGDGRRAGWAANPVVLRAARGGGAQKARVIVHGKDPLRRFTRGRKWR